MERKGVILKITNHQMIVLTVDRQFISLPYNPEKTVGQEVILPVHKKKEYIRRWRFPWKKTSVLVAFFLFALEFWQGIPIGGRHAYAYVTVDINPSIELAVDNQEHVVHVHALNDEGERLLRENPLDGANVEQAVTSIANTSLEKGYLKPQGEVFISTSRANREMDNGMDLTNLEKKLIVAVKEAISNKLPVDVNGMVVSEQIHYEAMMKGLSAGKYAFYLKARDQGLSVPLDELKRDSLTVISERYGLDVPKIVSQMDDMEKSDQGLSMEDTKSYPAFNKTDLDGNDRNPDALNKDQVQLNPPAISPYHQNEEGGDQGKSSGNKKEKINHFHETADSNVEVKDPVKDFERTDKHEKAHVTSKKQGNGQKKKQNHEDK